MWKVFVPEDSIKSLGLKNMDLVFPTKQRDVVALVKNFTSSADNIKQIVVFGSSVTTACNPWSDIDIYVEFIGDAKRVSYRGETCLSSVDYWNNALLSEEDDLYAEIREKGVLVWERP